ncbi:MAG: tetratricopeptide repeat protein [Candidatus Magnetobacterium sp. LHC-1]|uniref:Tetratricopeptide repeat protein n=1 Tax=Candidatus Magnetobacterium casense TaxID=1455061 RepID=A0ABS6RYA4_9BACT|nr:tetratricopeptide repeat protein [Candidatus Magnetobacterium casensis]MBF0608553.1 tetratricopeptide repeat protein [Nitrospirota bacterium]MBV6341624.1 tetratricopeptide repeat protein [Candidatus Magnetobacterium casensis]
MPKQIKKKVVKKVDPQNELAGVVEKFRGFYDTHRKEMLIAEVVLVSIVILSITVWGYVTFSKKAALSQQLIAYTTYHNMYQKSDPKNEPPKEQRYQKALEEFKKAYEKSKSPVSLFYIASAYYEMGKMDEAEKTLIELNKQYAGNEDILPLSLYKLFELYKGAGKLEKATETLQQMERLRTPVYKDIVLYQMAEILKKQGKDDESKKKMQELEKNYPNSPYIPPKPTQGDNAQAVQSIPISIPASGTKPSGQSEPPMGEKPAATAPEKAPIEKSGK